MQGPTWDTSIRKKFSLQIYKKNSMNTWMLIEDFYKKISFQLQKNFFSTITNFLAIIKKIFSQL